MSDLLLYLGLLGCSIVGVTALAVFLVAYEARRGSLVPEDLRTFGGELAIPFGRRIDDAPAVTSSTMTGYPRQPVGAPDY